MNPAATPTSSSETAGVAPLISVVIPVKNERPNIEACLGGIFQQSLRDKMEVIVIDSGSTDGTLDILAKHPVRVHQIPPAEFNAGETRNLGIRLARGEFVVMTVGDARAVDGRWIERMWENFADPRVAGVCGQQIVPHEPDKNPVEWFRPVTPPNQRLVHFKDGRDFLKLPAAEQMELCGWDDVTAMYRRSVMLEVPYRRVSYLCDTLWARDALAAGHALVHDTRAQVRHYHYHNFNFMFRKTYTSQRDSFHFFNHVRPAEPLFYSTARAAYILAREKSCSFPRKVRWFIYNVKLILGNWTATHLFRLVAALFGNAGVDRSHRFFCSRQPKSVRQAAAHRG